MPTVSNLTLDGTTGYYYVSDGESSGTYTSDVITTDDASLPARWLWSVEVDGYEQDIRPFSETWSKFLLGSVEARKWTLMGAEPSRNNPGADLDEVFSTWGGGLSIAEMTEQEYTLAGRRGVYGQHTAQIVEARFYGTAGSPSGWTAYARFDGGYRYASQMQVRVTLKRRLNKFQRYLTRFAARVSA